MNLFPEVDFNATAERVDTFLKIDFVRVLRMSGHQLTDLKSPELSLSPGHTNSINHNELTVINGISADAIVRAARQSIYHCLSTSKIILVGIYIDNLKPSEVANMVKYEHTQFYKLKRRALNEFADRYEYWERQYYCDPIVDLHVYRKNENGKLAE